jgi:hypothetical protein
MRFNAAFIRLIACNRYRKKKQREKEFRLAFLNISFTLQVLKPKVHFGFVFNSAMGGRGVEEGGTKYAWFYLNGLR